jgi:hypothetical protein
MRQRITWRPDPDPERPDNLFGLIGPDERHAFTIDAQDPDNDGGWALHDHLTRHLPALRPDQPGRVGEFDLPDLAKRCAEGLLQEFFHEIGAVPNDPIPDLVYTGVQPPTGGPGIIHVEDWTGQRLGIVRHVVRHSRGMSWGGRGSGAADTARSLLIAALGHRSHCRTCNGTVSVVALPGGDGWAPCDPAKAHPSEDIEPCPACSDGYRIDLPYQEFKDQHVATWADRFTITRSAILAWLTDQGIKEDQ